MRHSNLVVQYILGQARDAAAKDVTVRDDQQCDGILPEHTR